MIKIKSGVMFHLNTFQDYNIVKILWVAQMEAPKGYNITVTSGCDGEHSKNSAHYSGYAIDLRTKDFPSSVSKWADRVRKALGDNYIVLEESDHLHIGYRD